MCVSEIRRGFVAAAVFCVGLTMADATAATVPVAESFESYADSHPIVNEADWSGASSGAGLISTDAGAISALTTYTNGGGAFPLPAAAHEKVLAVSDRLTNTVTASGGVVITEWLVMPTLREGTYLPGNTNDQVAFYINTDTNIVIWRRDLAPMATNDWLELAATPTLDLAEWMRVTLTLDYATDRYQLAIDGTAISDAEGETRAGGSPGTWFHMVQSNGSMARFGVDSGVTTYMDDLVFTNRSLSYSGTIFEEPAANDGSIATTQTITLVNDSFVDPLTTNHVSAPGIPAGLDLSITRINATTAELTFTNSANAPHTADANITFSFLDTAFTLGSAASVVGYSESLMLDFHDGFGLDWPSTTFAEAPANNGTIDTPITVVLVGDTFVSGAYNDGDEYTVSGTVPAGLGLSVVYDDATHVTVSLTNAATSHDGGSGGPFTLTFNDAAFSTLAASALPNSATNLTVSFLAKPTIAYVGAPFAEASNNDGTIGNTVTATLTGDTFTGGARTLLSPADYSITSGAVPSGLALSIVSDGSTGLTLSLGSSASPHSSSENGSFEVTFTDALFANVAANDISGSSSPSLSVSFDDQPVISYSGTVFSELAYGTIDNTSPIEITLSGDAFSGANDSDFVADGKVTTNYVPAGLTLTLTKSSSTKLLARLIGTATANDDPGDDVNSLTIIFKDNAFAADADQVTGYSKTDLEVDFNNNTLTINPVPYSESFESYTDGDTIGIAQGWQPHGSALVTSETAIVSALSSGFDELPINTTHTKVLRLTQDTTDEVLSAPGGDLYTDVMLYMTGREDEPTGSADDQVAFYANDSEKLVLWHAPSAPGGAGAWLTTSVTVTTSAWHRVTVKQDQSNFRYQVYLDGSFSPVEDPAGFAARTGGTQPGSWFNMVDTSGFMSRIGVRGGQFGTPAYMDDLVVMLSTPEDLIPHASLFLMR